MQPLAVLERRLRAIASPEAYVFSVADLGTLVAGLDRPALKMVLSRAVHNGILARACRGLYVFPEVPYPRGRELFHIAAKLRSGFFNYISRETALSELGIISQLPLQYITLMSSGSSGIVDCGAWGRIEFAHTKKDLASLSGFLAYDVECRLLRADAELARADLVSARRNRHLLDEEGPA